MELMLIALLVPIAFVMFAFWSLFWRLFWYIGSVALVLALIVEVLKGMF